MIKHVNMWQYRPELTEEEKAEVRKGMKEALESLPGQITGMIDIVVRTELGPKSNADAMMEATFESWEALEAYRVDPIHVDVAVTKIRPFTVSRLGVDYEV